MGDKKMPTVDGTKNIKFINTEDCICETDDEGCEESIRHMMIGPDQNSPNSIQVIDPYNYSAEFFEPYMYSNFRYKVQKARNNYIMCVYNQDNPCISREKLMNKLVQLQQMKRSAKLVRGLRKRYSFNSSMTWKDSTRVETAY